MITNLPDLLIVIAVIAVVVLLASPFVRWAADDRRAWWTSPCPDCRDDLCGRCWDELIDARESAA